MKEAMFIKNMTTHTLSEITGINSGTISSYLKTKGSMPPADKALKIAEALEVSIYFLVNGFEKALEKRNVQKIPFSVEIYKLAQDLNGLEKDELNAIKNIIKVMQKNSENRTNERHI